jgi:hypothetical protein
MLANQLQMNDEEMTGKILLRRPRFVPFFSLNKKSNIHMQAPLQLLLPEKIRHWNRTMAKNVSIGNENDVNSHFYLVKYSYGT